MRIKRQIPFKEKKKIAAVVDGETEFWYLQMIKRNERNIKVDIKPEIPQKKKLADQYIKVLELVKVYDKVIWIVDFDVILSESQKTKPNQRRVIDSFFEYKNSIEKKHKDIVLIINQPCLELWLLLHFEYTAQQFTNCEGAEKILKKHLTDYLKSEKYFTKQDNDIYLKLKANLPKAISNSKKSKAFDAESPYTALTEMYKLFEAIEIP